MGKVKEKILLSYEDAKVWAISNNIKSNKHWMSIPESEKIKLGLPAKPYMAYLNKGWSNWFNFLNKDKCEYTSKGNKIIDITGQKFGKLTVLNRDIRYDQLNRIRRNYWVCLCNCGNKSITTTSALIHGQTRSCGCLVKKDIGINPFNRLFRTYKANAEKSNRIKITKGQNREYIFNGVDRFNNDKGYTIDNSIPCCKVCNYAKRHMLPHDFKNWIQRLINNNAVEKIEKLIKKT